MSVRIVCDQDDTIYKEYGKTCHCMVLVVVEGCWHCVFYAWLDGIHIDCMNICGDLWSG